MIKLTKGCALLREEDAVSFTTVSNLILPRRPGCPAVKYTVHARV
ncbi:hypothetical protein [Roseicyclus sp.]|nr:hypothetical protein [Roseicyclus sp.]